MTFARRTLGHLLLAVLGANALIFPMSARADSQEHAVSLWGSNTWQFGDAILEETPIAEDGLLSIRYTEISHGDDVDEITVDVLYGGFYLGELNDFLLVKQEFSSLESAQEFITKTPSLAAEINRLLHDRQHDGRVDAIDRFMATPEPGTEITYDYSGYRERLIVREPASISHPRSNDGPLRTVVVDVERYIRGEKTSTTTYWFDLGSELTLVQWGHDMGREYVMHVLMPD